MQWIIIMDSFIAIITLLIQTPDVNSQCCAGIIDKKVV